MFTYYPRVLSSEADARNARRAMAYTPVRESGPIVFWGRSIETRRGNNPTPTSNTIIGVPPTFPPLEVRPSNDALLDQSIQYMKHRPVLESSFSVSQPVQSFMVETRTRRQTHPEKGPFPVPRNPSEK
jgi:hypothetical protein